MNISNVTLMPPISDKCNIRPHDSSRTHTRSNNQSMHSAYLQIVVEKHTPHTDSAWRKSIIAC